MEEELSDSMAHSDVHCLTSLDPHFSDFIQRCLSRIVEDRPTVALLMQHPFMQTESCNKPAKSRPHQVTLQYGLWKLSGGNLLELYRKHNAEAQLSMSPTNLPILSLPEAMSSNGHLSLGDQKQSKHNAQKITIDHDRVERRLAQDDGFSGLIRPEAGMCDSIVGICWQYAPRDGHLEIIRGLYGADSLGVPEKLWNEYLSSYNGLYRASLDSREREFLYQYIRTAQFVKLLSQLPLSTDLLLEEAKLDIPRLVLNDAWKALLLVKEADIVAFQQLDTFVSHELDRQLDVDIPRCHQYHPLLRCLEGQLKLRRLLKAWILVNVDLVYWQGLDSICAPFLVLYFDNDDVAFACFQQFTMRFLKSLFVKDNSATIQSQMKLHLRLLRFHDPQLYQHLCNVGFTPDIYALPWFLTFYTRTCSTLWLTQIRLP